MKSTTVPRPSKRPPMDLWRVLPASTFLALAAAFWLTGLSSTWLPIFISLALVVFCLPPKVQPKSPNVFITSGQTLPATFSQELILTKRGGTGENFWCEPSLAFASISDFSFVPGRQVDFLTLLKEKGDCIGPYCVDDERRQIVFVETPAGFDPAITGPFYFQSQRKNAIRLFVVPYDEYHKVANELPNAHTDNLLLVYNTSRCGSTLLSKCLSSLTGVQSISEPDVFTSLAHMAAEAKGSRDEDIIAIARSSAKIICHLRRKRYPHLDAICLKFRFQQVYIADKLKEAIPDAKTMFLYRNALDVIDSMGAAFINTGAYRAIRAIGFDSLYVFYLSLLPLHLWKLMPLMLDTKRFPQKLYQGLGAVVPFVLSWLSVMHYAHKFASNGVIQASIRYEDMLEGKSSLIKKLLVEVGMRYDHINSSDEDGTESDSSSDAGSFHGRARAPSTEGSERHFTKDVHAQTQTRSRRTKYQDDGTLKRLGFAYLRGEDVSMITKVLSQHEILRSDSIIPGTLPLNNNM